MALRSMYNGWCKACNKPIAKGEMIESDPDIKNKDGKKLYFHADCMDKARAKFGEKKTTAAQALVGQAYTTSTTLKPKTLDMASIQNIEDIIVPDNTDFIPSRFQEGIFAFITSGEGNGVVEAVAGSGKTTTLVKALALIPKNKRTAFLAFNRHIAKELQARLRKMGLDHIRASTVHSLGLDNVAKLVEFKGKKSAEDGGGIDEDKLAGYMETIWPVSKKTNQDKYSIMKNRVLRALLRKIVSLCKATLVDYTDREAVEAMMERFAIDADENIPFVLAELPGAMEWCKKNTETVDYDDMIWLPVVHSRLRLHAEKFDWLLVDEAQDLNACQIEFILNSLAPGGRIIAVGDRKQSLYGFRGADTEAIPRLISELNATVLPLSISYRCPSKHVEMAKEIVPQIEASPTAKEGVFGFIEYERFLADLNDGDMVVCRTNAPLVKPAFECIKAGKKAIIRGKDIGKSLSNFVDGFNAETISQLAVLMDEYVEKEFQRLIDKNKELQAEMLLDKADTIRVVSNNCRTVLELMQKLEMLFSDSTAGVVFSSVHRAKGLEAERVFVLKPELMPHPKAKQDWELVQEDNTKYVALTRSKNELYFVEG